MTPRLHAFYGLILTSAAAFLVFVVNWKALASSSIQDYAGLLVFVGLAAFSDYLAVETGQSHRVKSSVAFLPLLAMALVFSPAMAVIGIALMFLGSALRATNWKHYFFNFSQTVLAYGLASSFFHFAIQDGQLGGGVAQTLALFFPFYGAALVVFGVNLLLISAYIAIRDRQSLIAVIHEAAGAGGGNLLYDILASPFGLLIAYLYAKYYIAGLLAFVFPLLLLRYTYLSALQLDRANHDLLRVLIKAIETRDPYTSGHSLRVSTLARMVAEDHSLGASQVRRIEQAALLHDIGKIEALYSDIISKTGHLSDEEFALIKTHATKGAQLLQSLTSLERDVIDGVRHHHEKYDGSGYPDGLRGKSIPLAARIIMLCDSIDAMLSDRPYRDALFIPDVQQELLRCSGTQFDPDLVDTIIRSNTLERAELLVDRAGARARVRVAVG